MTQGNIDVLGYNTTKLFEILSLISDVWPQITAAQTNIQSIYDFQKEIEALFSQYANHATQAAHDALMVTTKREQRLRMVIDRE